MNCRVACEQEEIANRLTQLDLSSEAIRVAVAEGEQARASCSVNDPSIAPGFFAWARTTRGLRDHLAPLGWRKCDDGGLDTVLSKDGSVAIVVSTGSRETGIASGCPKTKSPKGPRTEVAVCINQMCLFVEYDSPPCQDIPRGRITWFLLVARDGDEVRCELSLPAGIGEDGRVDEWQERIILEPVRSDTVPKVDRADDQPDVGVDVAIMAE